MNESVCMTLYFNTGTTLIASINSGRHCVSVESSNLQYIWAKVRAVKAINPVTTDKNDEEKNKAEDSKEDKEEAEAGNEEKSEEEARKEDADE